MKTQEQKESHKPGGGADCSFRIGTKLARSTGVNSRYSLGAVRALPGTRKGQVVLQATDGHQAVCLVAPGHTAKPQLVPSTVMPSRQPQGEVEIQLENGQWRSSEGKTVEVPANTADARFPPLSESMPVLHKRPFYETPALAKRRRQANPKAESVHVVLGIDVDLLRRVAESLGDSKLTLFVPVPVRGPKNKPNENYVNKPVAICPATDDGAQQGIAVVMPLNPTLANGHYERIRQVVVESEQKEKRLGRI